ncbi:hypothetical protein [Exiguobacterium artemiae]
MIETGDLVMLTNQEDRQGRTKVTAVTNRLIWIEAPSEVSTLKTFILSDQEQVGFYFLRKKESCMDLRPKSSNVKMIR